MSKNAYILPVYFSEFITWYRFGKKNVLTTNLIPIDINKKDLPRNKKVVQSVGSRIATQIPDFEEDFEVLLVQFELSLKDIFVVLANSWIKPKSKQVPFHSIMKVYPITTKGKMMLENRLEHMNIKIEKPLWEKQIKQTIENRQKQLCKDGALSLLAIVYPDSQFKMSWLKDKLNSFTKCYGNEVINVLFDKQEILNNSKLISPFFKKLFSYSRMKPYPKNDIGYFYDYGNLLRSLNESGIIKTSEDNLNDLFKSYSKNLKIINEKYNDKTTPIFFNKLLVEMEEPLTKIEDELIAFSPKTTICYLKLTDMFNENRKDFKQSLRGIKDQLVVNYEQEFINAVCLIGMKLNFIEFSSEYYDEIKSKIIRNDSPDELFNYRIDKKDQK